MNADGSSGGSLSISVGVAVYPYHGKTLEAFVEGADMAMYEAKREGKNRVIARFS